MSTLKTTNLQHASAASPAIVLDANSRATLNGLSYPTEGSLSGRNRVINGAMVVDARNAGASVTNTAGSTLFSVDRWSLFGSQASKFTVQQNAGSVTTPAGFRNYLGVTSSSAYTVGASETFYIRQRVEGYNVSDFNWGTASAVSATLSFWARSSLTGTFGGSVGDPSSGRYYPFTYTISAANTWEYKTITIAGDTNASWAGSTTNGVGLELVWSLGIGSTYSGTANTWNGGANAALAPTGATSVVGTNGATFYITGVQLEAGSVATPFERRSYGQELALCQRYYYKMQSSGGNSYFGTGYNYSTTGTAGLILFPVTMRAAPSALEQSGTAGDYRIAHGTSSTTCSSVPIWDSGDVYSARVAFTVASGLTTGQGSMLRSVNSTAYLAWSAEL